MSTVKSFEQLAQAAYEAYRKMAVEIDQEGMAGYAESWAELEHGTQACWIAAARQLWAEFAAIH